MSSLVNKSILLVIILSISFSSYRLYLPTIDKNNNQIIHHSFYSLSYNEKHEQADWVMYELTKDMIQSGVIKRKDSFRVDPEVKSGSAKLLDYKKSGYDRGHLCPAGDMKISKTAMSESFYMSNMSPQAPSFNRGIWKKLESYVRDWATENNEIYVVTGGVLNSEIITTIGKNNVSVPKYYYKVILDYRAPEIKGIGFILPNEKGVYELEAYALSIDQVEEITGIDFFSSMPDSLENTVEKSFIINKWISK